MYAGHPDHPEALFRASERRVDRVARASRSIDSRTHLAVTMRPV